MLSGLSRALVVLAEALVSGKRVLVVGDARLELDALLAELGARVVHVYDPSLTASPERGTVVRPTQVVRPMPEGDFDVRDGAFDLAIVPDVASIDDPAALLARLRRVVGTDGAVMCAASNPDGPHATGTSNASLTMDYYALYDLASLQFENVRMIAAMPFNGLTLAELGQDEVDSAVRVDTQLAGERPAPSAFIALASQSDVALDAYTVIELDGQVPVAAMRAPDPEASAALAQEKLRVTYLEAQLEELVAVRASRSVAEEEAKRAHDALDVERERAVRLERELDAKRVHVDAPPPAPARREEDLAEQLAEAQLRAAALEEGVELAEKTIIIQRDRIAEVEAAFADLEQARLARSTIPPLEDRGTEEDVAMLEAKLKERGETIAALEAEIARRDKLVRELVMRLDNPSNGQADENLATKLDELAVLAARQRSELEARAWQIAELERSRS